MLQGALPPCSVLQQQWSPPEVKRILTVTGEDALEFLQGQLTQDVARVSQSSSLWSAWCNAKGRVQATMRLLSIDGGFGLILPLDLCEAVVQRLAMYRFRSRVEFALSGDDWTAVAVQAADDITRIQQLELLPVAGETLTSLGIHAVRPHTAVVFVELYGPAAAFRSARLEPHHPLAMHEWQAARIIAGMPDIGAANTERYTPHMLNLDRLDAISFDKGCYTGQEIVARTENLGRSKRRLAGFTAQGPGIVIGDKLVAGDREVGDVVNVSGAELLAVTPLDLHMTEMRVGTLSIAPRKLPYSVPASSE